MPSLDYLRSAFQRLPFLRRKLPPRAWFLPAGPAWEQNMPHFNAVIPNSTAFPDRFRGFATWDDPVAVEDDA